MSVKPVVFNQVGRKDGIRYNKSCYCGCLIMRYDGYLYAGKEYKFFNSVLRANLCAGIRFRPVSDCIYDTSNTGILDFYMRHPFFLIYFIRMYLHAAVHLLQICNKCI